MILSLRICPDYESAEAYRQSVYDNLYKQNMYNALFQYVVENSEIKDVPEEVVDTVYNERYQYYTSIASMYGVGIDAFLSANGLDEDSFRDSARHMQETILYCRPLWKLKVGR